MYIPSLELHILSQVRNLGTDIDQQHGHNVRAVRENMANKGRQRPVQCGQCSEGGSGPWEHLRSSSLSR